jgi:hypothetical protein
MTGADLTEAAVAVEVTVIAITGIIMRQAIIIDLTMAITTGTVITATTLPASLRWHCCVHATITVTPSPIIRDEVLS